MTAKKVAAEAAAAKKIITAAKLASDRIADAEVEAATKVQTESERVDADMRTLAVTLSDVSKYVISMQQDEKELIKAVSGLNTTIASLTPLVEQIPVLLRSRFRHNLLIGLGYSLLFVLFVGGGFLYNHQRIQSVCENFKNARNDVLIYNKAIIDFSARRGGPGSDPQRLLEFDRFVNERLPQRKC